MSSKVVDIASAEDTDPSRIGRAVISTIGQDRPGLVSELTERVTALSLSIDDSRMSILGGEFAVLMSVTGTVTNLASLEAQLNDYCRTKGLACLFRRSSDRIPVNALPYQVAVTAMDHPGIVHRVAAFFSNQGINIVDLRTETAPAPHTGTPLFSLVMTIELAPDAHGPAVKAAFSEFCLEEDLDGEMDALSQ